MPVLSVDLAHRRWSDLGIVVLDRAHPAQTPAAAQPGTSAAHPVQPLLTGSLAFNPDQNNPADLPIACEIIPSISPGVTPGPVDADILAGLLNHLSNVRGIRVIMLDGPQAWKSRSNGLEHSRVSERQLNTAAKTGLPGMVKPITYRPFAEFCLDVFDALCRRGWRRLETSDQPGSPPDRVLVESYPFAAWKSLGLKPLPSKRRTRISDLAEAYGALRSLIPFTTNRPPNHDQLQAIVGGLPGLALEERNTACARIVGTPPRREEGHWREGFIVLPVVPPRPLNTARSTSLRFLD
jgi:hypothetical protein